MTVPHDPTNQSFLKNEYRSIIGQESHIVTHGPIRPYKKDPSIYVEEYAYIGKACILLPGIRIGRCAIVGAGSVVAHDIDPYTINAGNPVRFIRMRDGHEMLRFLANYEAKRPQGSAATDWTFLDGKIEEIKRMFGLPRSVLREDDPAYKIYVFLRKKQGLEEYQHPDYSQLTTEDMFEVYGIERV